MTVGGGSCHLYVAQGHPSCRGPTQTCHSRTAAGRAQAGTREGRRDGHVDNCRDKHVIFSVLYSCRHWHLAGTWGVLLLLLLLLLWFNVSCAVTILNLDLT